MKDYKKYFFLLDCQFLKKYLQKAINTFICKSLYKIKLKIINNFSSDIERNRTKK